MTGVQTCAIPIVLAQRVSKTLGQTVTVENRPGSVGINGSAEVARSPADGYTLLVNSTVLAVDKWFYPNVAYDARKAFAPVALLATIPSVLVVPADSPYKDARSLLAYAKANPGKVSFASAGMGTSIRSEEHTSELQSLMRISYAVFCLKKKNNR